MTHASVKDQVLANYLAQHDALVAGDYDALGELLSEGFTRTHINGRSQTKEQWLKHLRTGELKYHTFEEVEMNVKVDGSRATLSARTISDATLYGERKHWKLHLRQTFLKSNGRWLASHSVATPW